MAEGTADSWVKRHFQEVREHWRRNLSFLDYYKKLLGREEPLPKWTDADIDEFIASDPVYGPQLKIAREATKFGVVGSLIGAAHLAGIALKYSKSPHGVVLAGGFGAVCGMTFGLEAANHWYKLYNLDCADAHLRFHYWWEDKVKETKPEVRGN